MSLIYASASLAMLVLSLFGSLVSAASPNFTYNSNQFLLNGEPFQIIGGQMDPQRIPPPYWRQRLTMARAMGLNTVFSYIFWNNIEPSQGEWDFEGRNDVATFFRTAQEEGLHVVLRPGPYVCGEHEWGGFPAWLAEIPGMEVRSNNEPFLSASAAYLQRLGEHLSGLHVSKGGPILMTQLENEYGSFDSDKQYLQALADLLYANFDGFLYTNDGGGQSYLDGGYLHGVLAETDGDPHVGFEARNTYVTDSTCLGPLLDGEYYITWFDKWASNSTYSTFSGNESEMDAAVADLEWILQGNNSFSIYMFHGGTNFGFENGGIWIDDSLAAVTTSYDYGAPLDESGRPTEIYYKIRDMISKYVPEGSIPPVPEIPSLASVGTFDLNPQVSLWHTPAQAVVHNTTQPVAMESLGQAYGYVLYQYTVLEPISGILSIGDGPRDRIIVYVGGVKIGVIDRTYPTPASILVNLDKWDTLQLFVENLGRVDYGQMLRHQLKGIVGDVTIGNQTLTAGGWASYAYSVDTIPPEVFHGLEEPVFKDSPPIFYTGYFTLPPGGAQSADDLSSDTFLTVNNSTKGQVWVNGINLGRYWNIGPQQSLYLPGCYLKANNMLNEVVVLDLESHFDTLTGVGLSTRQWFNNVDADAS